MNAELRQEIEYLRRPEETSFVEDVQISVAGAKPFYFSFEVKSAYYPNGAPRPTGVKNEREFLDALHDWLEQVLGEER